jgi:hypothetical protein
MAVSSVGVRLKSDCSGKAQKQLYSKLQTRFLVREDALIAKRRNCQTKKEEQDKIWSRVPKGGPIPRRTGRLTVGRKKNSNSNSSSQTTEQQINTESSALDIHFCSYYQLSFYVFFRRLIKSELIMGRSCVSASFSSRIDRLFFVHFDIKGHSVSVWNTCAEDMIEAFYDFLWCLQSAAWIILGIRIGSLPCICFLMHCLLLSYH